MPYLDFCLLWFPWCYEYHFHPNAGSIWKWGKVVVISVKLVLEHLCIVVLVLKPSFLDENDRDPTRRPLNHHPKKIARSLAKSQCQWESFYGKVTWTFLGALGFILWKMRRSFIIKIDNLYKPFEIWHLKNLYCEVIWNCFKMSL